MSKRVMIVDDDSLLTKFFEFEINKNATMPIHVVAADSCNDAIANIDRVCPDLLVLDIRLPGADGFTVLDHIAERNYKFPVLILTNYDKDEYRQKCHQYEVVLDYLLKRTMVPRQLVRTIEEYLEKHAVV